MLWMGGDAMTFSRQLSIGKVGESRIAQWMNGRGWSVLPVYEIEINTGKGPRLFAPQAQLIAPDMFVFNGQDAYWLEAKYKTAFSWHRITSRWVTGIDLKHYHDYCIIDDSAQFPVWLMFLQCGEQAKDSPAVSPSGLYGNTLSYLRQNENHRHQNWGRGGMVYWSIEHLKKLAGITEL